MISRSLVGTFKHVWSQDPALDMTDAEKFQGAYKKFVESGKLEDLAPVIREGQEPAVFEIGRLSRKQWLRVSQERGFQGDCEAVAYGLRAVSGFNADGEPVVIEREDTADGLKRIKPDCLDRLYDPFLFRELSERILEVSRISPLSASG